MEKVKIVILAGGKGTRLKPLTETVPKPLVTLNGKPVLEYAMSFCAKNGFKEFVICTGYKADMVVSAVNSFKKDDWKIDFVNSGEEASMLKRIIDASEKCSEKFVVCYGDTVADINLNELILKHEKNNALITNVLYQMESPFGLMETNEKGKIISYKEKPLLPFWFNIGYFVFSKEALNYVKNEDWISFLEQMVKTNRFFAEKHTGEHITFNTEQEKLCAEKKINVFSHVFEEGVDCK